MRTLSTLLTLLAIAFPAVADDKTKKPAPVKQKIAYILTNTKAAIFDVTPPVTLRLFRGMPFEYLGKVERTKKVYYKVRFLNGETLYIKGAHTALKLMVVKLPSYKTQREIYKKMAELDRRAEAAAKKRASGMAEGSSEFFKRKFLREYYAMMVGRYRLTNGTWLKIKAQGDAGWPKYKKKKKKKTEKKK